METSKLVSFSYWQTVCYIVKQTLKITNCQMEEQIDCSEIQGEH